MSSHHPLEMDSGTIDSLASTPRSEHHPRTNEDFQPRVRFMCSFGGQILPRPHDNQLRYVGGDTRIVAVNRSTGFTSLLTKLSKLSGTNEITIKYQLPNEDLDALISVSTDEDVENMMDEYDRLVQASNNPKLSRLRLFLFVVGNSRCSSISSILDGSTKRESWFLDALNGGSSASLDRGRSEVSSIVSEVPDYLFGLDNILEDQSRESKLKNKPVLPDSVSVSDPGSPAPPISSPYCSTSSSIPNLPPVKTKPANQISAVETREEPRDPVMVQQQTGYTTSPVWHYVQEQPQPQPHYPAPPQQVPVYYMQSPVHHQVQQVQMQQPGQYVQRFQPPVSQIPMGYRTQVPGMGQMYGGGMRPVTHLEAAYEYSSPSGVISPEQGQQAMYYGGRNGPMLHTYGAAMVQQPGTEQLQSSGGKEMKMSNNMDPQIQ